MLQLTGADDAARHDSYQAIKAELTPASLASSGVTARVGGTVPILMLAIILGTVATAPRDRGPLPARMRSDR